VLAGLECTSHVGLTGALSLWISSALALAGTGMTLCVLEARRGELELGRSHGGYESTPLLAKSFLLLGLCCVGFPGTLGFVGSELLFDGSVAARPRVGIAVGVAAVLNAITVLRMYFALFAGARRPVNRALRLIWRERVGFALLVAALVAGGVVPQPIVDSRRAAADGILAARRELAPPPR
jgi:NADH-quinone oxidoreductase subunit M